MFSKRCRLNGSRKYSREFFERLTNDLRSSGFTNIKVLLPHNQVPARESLVEVSDLLRLERNFPSLILVARSEERDETLKTLFVNRNSRAVFVDDTFPNGESEPPQLFFQSPDPGRTYSVFHFFREYLERPSLRAYYLLWFGSAMSFVFLLAEIFTVLELKDLFLGHLYRLHTVIDVCAIVVAVAIIFRFFGEPKGLWIKPSRELRLFYLANMAIRGDFRDNPLVSIVVAITTTVATALVMRWIGLM